MSNLQIAREYIEAGISILPIRCDGTKAPACSSWNGYRERFATDDELQRWFPGSGIGIVCGVLSGGLEVLDFDHDADATFNQWRDMLSADICGQLCVVETGGLGYHVLYRCEKISGNRKIAMTKDSQVKVESRGEGGYIVGVGSPLEVHSSGNPYVQTYGDPLPSVPVFTPEQREAMWVAAASFDSTSDLLVEYVNEQVKLWQPNESDPGGDYADMPGSDFDRRGSWQNILTDWKRTKSGWRHPNANTPGHSAVVRTNQAGNEVLVVYSTNASSLAPSGANAHRTWGKFDAYAVLNHGGDRSKAAKQLWKEGYGKR